MGFRNVSGRTEAAVNMTSPALAMHYRFDWQTQPKPGELEYLGLPPATESTPSPRQTIVSTARTTQCANRSRWRRG